jgi:hypothetical protein
VKNYQVKPLVGWVIRIHVAARRILGVWFGDRITPSQ